MARFTSANTAINSALSSPETGEFKPAEELRKLYEQHGITPDKEAVTYCRTAERASHTWFALNLLGYPSVRIYDGP